ncbi:MAG: histidine kinase dimerization/phosphoacceptor domain -containing protein [Desulfovibrionales bacterium]|nr:histidine kinase dimerization/phosphoacceptor domain -containing protein [Desulfovibrionales bacterium]
METKGLSNKVVIGTIAGLASIAILLYTAYLSHREFEDTLVSHTQEQLLTVAKTTAGRLEEVIGHLSKHLRVLADDSIVQEEIYKGALCQERRTCPIENFYEGHKGYIDSMVTCDVNGIILHRYPFREDARDRVGMSLTDKPDIAYVVREHKLYVSEWFYNNLGKPAISIAQPVFYKDKFVGVVRCMIGGDTLSNIFIQPIERVKGSQAWILDEKGTLLAHSDAKQQGKDIIAHRKKAFSAHDWSALEHIIEKARRGEEGAGIYICATCGKRLIAYAPVHIGNQLWSIGVSMDYSEITGPLYRHAAGQITIAGLVILLFAAGGFTFYKIEKKNAADLRRRNEELKQKVIERKRAEEALRESEEKLAGIVDSVTDQMIMVDEQFNIVWVNDVARALFGPDIVGKKCYIAYHGRDRVCDKCMIKECFEDGRVHEFETEITGTDGVSRVFWGTASVAARYEDGRPMMVVEFLRDITERKRAEKDIETLKQQMEFILGATKTGLDIIDSDFNVRYIDPEWGKIYGDPTGRKCYEYFMGLSDMCPGCGIPIVLETKAITVTEEALVKEGNRPIQVTTIPFQNEEGEWLIAEVNVDITERKRAEEQIRASLREKEVLLKEIHHRVKNNLQVISSLLRLQSQYVQDKGDVEIFKESQNRIKSMALVHEKLYQSKDLASINFHEYVSLLVNGLFRSYGVNTDKITLKTDIEDIMLGVDVAIPCGLIINELVSNSLKYAFPEDKEGGIKITLRTLDEGAMELTVADNGVGLPGDWDLTNSGSLGLKLVKILTDQIDGQIDLDRSEGTKFRIDFKKTTYEKRI